MSSQSGWERPSACAHDGVPEDHARHRRLEPGGVDDALRQGHLARPPAELPSERALAGWLQRLTSRASMRWRQRERLECVWPSRSGGKIGKGFFAFALPPKHQPRASVRAFSTSDLFSESSTAKANSMSRSRLHESWEVPLRKTKVCHCDSSTNLDLHIKCIFDHFS